MIYFKPQLWPTVLMLMALVILIGLGNWQLERRAWKLALIADVESRIDAPPISLQRAIGRYKEGEPVEYVPATARGTFLHDREIHLFRQRVDGAGGYHIFTPFQPQEGPILFVNRGYVPPDKKEPASRLEGQIEGLTEVTGLIRTDGTPGMFVPPNNAEKGEWFSRDHKEMAAAAGLVDVAPVFLDLDDTANPGGLPQGGQTRITFKNDHLGYALTWFGLAVVLVGVYLAHQASAGRLAISSGKGQ